MALNKATRAEAVGKKENNTRQVRTEGRSWKP
jgi:hypothetical protein